MRRWEFVTPQPTIEFEYDGDKGNRSLYVPKLRVTFYIYEDYTKAFAEKILPVALAYVASTWNLLHVGQKQDADYVDYRVQIKSHGAFEASRRPRHRRCVCSTACRCGSLNARPS